MTEVRDIPESFEFLKNFWSDIENVRNAEVELVQSDILSYLRWCEEEKARADKAEAREMHLRTLLESERTRANGTINMIDHLFEHLLDKEEEAK